jgi:hypothetical protein
MLKYVSKWCIAATLLAVPFVMIGCSDTIKEKTESSSTDVERDGTVVKKESETTTTTTNP